MTGAAVCFADSEPLAAVPEGFGPRPAELAAALARRDLDVHLLVCGEGDGAEEPGASLREVGVIVHHLEEVPSPPGAKVQRYGGDDPTLVLGERALDALEVLHAEYGFKLIEFPADGALGMRTVQAKRSGDVFADVAIAVRARDPGFPQQAILETPAAPRELKRDYCERYVTEHADFQLDCSGNLPGDDAALEAQYRGLVEHEPSEEVTSAASGTVTVVVAHYNHECYLAGALASLATQTRPPDQVLVIDDGSTCEAALRVFAEQEARYPDWTFVRQENAGPGPARNHGLEHATGTYFLPFDSDNIAVPTMLERLSKAMDLNPSRAATTCHNLGFNNDDEISEGRFASRYSPTGGPRILACVENVYGDTCSLFRTEALRSVGGFEMNRWSPAEDWETFAKMATRGLEIDVLPRPLFYYRTDAGGRLQKLGTERATKLRLRAHLVDEFFAGATLSELERRQLFEFLQAFDDFATYGVQNRLDEQRRWHDSQMADLAAFRDSELEKVRARLCAEADSERVRAERAEHELAALSRATSGRVMRRLVRWRMR